MLFRISGRVEANAARQYPPRSAWPTLRSANFEHAGVPVLEVWRCEAVGNFESCPELPTAIAWLRHVDRYTDRLAKCRAIKTAIALPIEQEPDWRLAHRHAILDRCRRRGTQSEHRLRHSGAARRRHLAFRMHQPLICYRARIIGRGRLCPMSVIPVSSLVTRAARAAFQRQEMHLLLCQGRYRGALVEVALAGDAVEEVGI